MWHAIAHDESMPECPISRFGKHSDTKRVEAKSKLNSTNDRRVKLLEYAEQQRLHTDLQKSIFIALMDSENPEHAVQRILEVAHQKHEVISD